MHTDSEWKEDFKKLFPDSTGRHLYPTQEEAIIGFIEALLKRERDDAELVFGAKLLQFIHGKDYEIYILRFLEEYRANN